MLLASVILLLCTAWVLAGTASVFHTVRRPHRSAPADDLPGISVLKPLAGADPGLERNLVTFFEQSYPRFELVFGVEDPHDPAIAVVERLRKKYPGVPSRLVVHDGAAGTNPKVRNLRGMLPAARHDLVLVSDSNIRAARDYLEDAEREMRAGDRVGLVTHLFSGVDEDSLGGLLESVQLSGFCAAGSAVATWLGDAAVIGKSMLFSRRAFDALGGLESVSHVLAEDYVMGKKFQHAGYEVRVGRTVLENVTTGTTLRRFFERQIRWTMMRYRLRPLAFLLEPLASPVLLAPVAAHYFGASSAALWALALLLSRDVAQWLLLRGVERAWVPMLLAPVRDLAMFLVWLRAPFSKHVSWRGHRVRLSAGTLAYACAPNR